MYCTCTHFFIQIQNVCNNSIHTLNVIYNVHFEEAKVHNEIIMCVKWNGILISSGKEHSIKQKQQSREEAKERKHTKLISTCNSVGSRRQNEIEKKKTECKRKM